MRVDFSQYIFDFKNMHTYGNFALRKNHAGIYTNSYGEVKASDRPPNLELIQFQEMRYIGDTLRLWWKDEMKWEPIFPYAANRRDILNSLYLEYVFERDTLGAISSNEIRFIPTPEFTREAKR